MFSNGTEYESFLSKNCFQCPHYVHFDEATEAKPCCPIEEQIALCGITDEAKAPLEWLDENGYMHRYDCRKKAGKEKMVKER